MPHDKMNMETIAVAAPPARILVVEDEDSLLFTVAHNLKKEGYHVITSARGDDGLRLAREERPDLILLDVMLPGLDGIQVTRLLRRDTDIPIIMMTALAGERDRVAGLDTGADDYLTKPFGMRELLARVRALLRRSAHTNTPASERPAEITSGDITIDTARRRASRDDLPLALKPKEYDLLLFFVQHRGRIFTREQILNSVWEDSFDGGARTVDVHVRWLRQKIEDDPAQPVRLRTARGSGYLFEG